MNNMAKKEKLINQPTNLIFTCHAPNAETVFLAGSFNDWDPARCPMTRHGDGTWRAELPLPVGRYEYKFVVNGNWCCEPGCKDTAQCHDCVPNAFGTMNRVIDITGETRVVEVGSRNAA
jgi:5'-AMP-activated protein kinase regulatory beta subunit